MQRIEPWPEARQDAAAHLLIEMEEQDSRDYSLTQDQAAEVCRRRSWPNRKFMTLAEVRGRLDPRR
ncbi:MAG: hypothetical protein JO163_22935 [Methylobacteriaceae bacterium]|nr:hypothetical protein [Methylobacteriaceae bacterium]